ncbi:MAG TPA: hypothetical protein VF588_20485 [Pyrinomonadaceae bacterium]
MDLKGFRVVVSAENNAYMAWQSQLFHYSCVTRLGQTPLVVVHGPAEAPLSKGFGSILRAGGLVRRAPCYRTTAAGAEYPPRNAPATLLHAAEMNYFGDEFFVLCDPDMLFVRPPVFARTLAADRFPSSMLDFGHRDVRAAARRYGVAHEELDGRDFSCGVPHVVPAADAARLGAAWLEAVDAFRSRLWEVSMYAFGFAVVRLGMGLEVTRLACFNYYSHDPLPPEASVIHYFAGDRHWSKRRFWSDADAPRVWDETRGAPEGTILGEMLSQLRGARSYYSADDIW